MRDSRRFRAIERMIRKSPVRTVALVRAAYLPVVIKNYGLSVMDVSIQLVLFWTLLTGFGFSFMWSSIGSQIDSLTNVSDKHLHLTLVQQGFKAVPIALLLAIMFYALRTIRRAEQDHDDDQTRLFLMMNPRLKSRVLMLLKTTTAARTRMNYRQH